MEPAQIANLLAAFAPVAVLLVMFERLDVFRLVSGGAVATYAALGAGLAAVSYISNGHVMDGLPIGFTDYSRYVAPVIEETLKALVIVALFATDRVGFKLDAAIAGFAVGAGFSMFENGYLLVLFPGANLGVWLVRGFGTAVMHGGATALFAVITHEFSEHQAHHNGVHTKLYPWVFLPGLLVAIAVHSAFNHLPGDPLLAMLGAMVLIPLTLLAVFAKGARRRTIGWRTTAIATPRFWRICARGGSKTPRTGAPWRPWPKGFRPASPARPGSGSSCSWLWSYVPKKCCWPTNAVSGRWWAPPSTRTSSASTPWRGTWAARPATPSSPTCTSAATTSTNCACSATASDGPTSPTRCRGERGGSFLR